MANVARGGAAHHRIDSRRASRPANNLSPEQQTVVEAGRNVFLQACPGSGKTMTVAGRVAHQIEAGHSVALLSYTRTGASEIGSAIARDFGHDVADSHFLGTLHSFLLKYVVRPFGHLIAGTSTAMLLDPTQAKLNSPAGLDVAHFEYGVGGDLRRTRGRVVRDDEVREMTRFKLERAREGYIGYSDALHYAVRVLTEYKAVAHALAARFDEIVIDEAQDTNVLQLQCIRLLLRSGLKSLVLVGDYDQQIYEFAGASSTGCEDLAAEFKLTRMSLRENYRSSQLICDAAAKFRANDVPDLAVGEFAEVAVPPQLVTYGPGDESDLPGYVDRLVQEYDLSVESIGVLTRAAGLGEAITGSKKPRLDDRTKSLLQAKGTPAGGVEIYKSLERQLLSETPIARNAVSRLDDQVLRGVVARLVSNLPDLSGSLFDWVERASDAFDAAVSSISPLSKHAERALSPVEWKGIEMETFLDQNESVVATVHSAKGRSIDAVMLVAAEPTQSWQTPNAFTWAQAFTRDSTPELSEEVRLAYVALTRARQLFVLALPESTPRSVVQAFVSVGFHEGIAL